MWFSKEKKPLKLHVGMHFYIYMYMYELYMYTNNTNQKHKTYRKFFFNLIKFTDYHTDRQGWLCWKTIDHLFKLGLHQQIWNKQRILIIEIYTVLKTDWVIYFSMHNQPYALKKYYIYWCPSHLILYKISHKNDSNSIISRQASTRKTISSF